LLGLCVVWFLFSNASSVAIVNILLTHSIFKPLHLATDMKAQLKALLVDDNPINLRVMEKICTLHLSDTIDIASIERAHNGTQALTAFAKSMSGHPQVTSTAPITPVEPMGYFDIIPLPQDTPLKEFHRSDLPPTPLSPPTHPHTNHHHLSSQSSPFDLILLDIDMPDISGTQVAGRIRAMSTSRHRPIILAVTTNVSTESLQRYRNAGIDGCVEKPIDVPLLCGMIHDSINRQAEYPTTAFER